MLAQPPVVHIPSSDLSSQLLEPPIPGHDATFMFSFSYDLGSPQVLIVVLCCNSQCLQALTYPLLLPFTGKLGFGNL
jgi:hypothetical protein